ncbi:hypothetical protein [Streptomyces olivaceiscleroticus]|uniref:Fibronectin type-III domain-containing protein n=1 Tax=Streptomyces olivaceiscleroticus TaxID=68245 RepID=A0ABP3LKD2_9ACTN
MSDRSLAAEVARLRRQVEQIAKGQRVAHGASLENAALQVNDDTGTLRAIIGVQDDGTAGVVAVNGPPPPAPSAPILTPSISGLRVTWDGALNGGSELPADFDHIAVYISGVSGFEPSTATFAGTITKAGDGGMLPITPLPYIEHYVRFVGVNTSGIGGAPSAETAGTPVQVTGPDLTAGSVTAGTIAAGAVTADKLEAILVLASRILAGSPAGARVELNSDGLRAYDAAGNLTVAIDGATGEAMFSGEVIGGGLTLTGTSGAVMALDPDAQFPNIRFSSQDGTRNAYIAVGDLGPQAKASLSLQSGNFTAGGVDWNWRHLLGGDALVAERRRYTDGAVVGGRLNLVPTYAELSYTDSVNSQITSFNVNPGYANLAYGRLRVLPLADANTALYVETASGHTGPMMRVTDAATGRDRFKVETNGNTTIDGILNARSIVTGSVNITPSAANTPTSAIVSFNCTGTTFRGYVTANSAVPAPSTGTGGTANGVNGVSISSVSATGATVWLNRQNTTATTVNWMVIGS